MAAIMSSSFWPARPTKGRPVRSSFSPGPSPMNMSLASGSPSPKTVCLREGDPDARLVFAGAFADEHEPGIRIAFAKDGVLARCVKLALFTDADLCLIQVRQRGDLLLARKRRRGEIRTFARKQLGRRLRPRHRKRKRWLSTRGERGRWRPGGLRRNG